jgi:hypothetical protein
MTRMLKQLYSVDKWHPELQEFAKDWDEVSATPVAAKVTAFDQLAIETINDAVLDLISEASASATAGAKCYSSEKFTEDTTELAPLFLHHIPPGETGSLNQNASVDLVSIINAGWHVYLCDFELFRKSLSLHSNDAVTRFAAATKLHELVLKALEISGIRTLWEEAQRDSKLRKN